MSKIKKKTKRAASKRIKVTATGKLMRKHAHRSHLAHNKSTKQKRQLRKDAVLTSANLKQMERALGSK